MFFNPLRPAYLANPYPALALLREREPVMWCTDVDAWVVTRHADALAVLDSEGTFSADPSHASGGRGRATTERRTRVPMGTVPILANSDGAKHAALRTVVARSFTPRTIEAMAPGIDKTVADLMEHVEPNRPFDTMAGLAGPLAVTTVLQVLGIPASDAPRFREAARSLMRVRVEGAADAATAGAALRARAELHMLLDRWEQDRDGLDGVLAVLLDALDEGVEREEALMLLVHLATAGNSTTAMAIGNAILALATDPDAYDELKNDPTLLLGSVDEFLRFDSPTHVITRWASEQARLGSRTIPRGQSVHVMVGSASRDPEAFDSPDRLDIGRSVPRPLAFGTGVHACLGAALARLEIAAALRALLERYRPGFRVKEIRRADTYVLRGPGALVIVAA